MDILEKRDVFIVAGTGLGKTVILQAGPLAASGSGRRHLSGHCSHQSPRRTASLKLSLPPIEYIWQADVATARGLHALAVNEDTIREAALEKRDLWAELLNSKGVRVAVMTPQMVLGKKMQQLPNSRAFVASIRWVSIDEAQLINQLDGVFARWYLRLSCLRVKLNPSTVWAAVTATAAEKHVASMAKKLGFKAGAFEYAPYSVDRPNIKYIPRFLSHPYTGDAHLDLSFVILKNMSAPEDIPSTVILAKMRRGGGSSQTLCSRVSLHYNSEVFGLHDDCCGPIHDATASSVLVVAAVTAWAEFLAAQNEAASVTDGGELKTNTERMQKSFRKILHRWIYQKWARIRPSTMFPAAVFVPPSLASTLVNKAHLCFDLLDNLRIISGGWKYFDEHGPALLAMMNTSMAGDSGRVFVLGRTEAVSTRNSPDFKELCHVHGCTKSGKKVDIVLRLKTHFFSINAALPGRAEVERINTPDWAKYTSMEKRTSKL
ncbi:hypothetical protein C8F01DRAFT_1077795 [Mycena amicta]|nr:hypothetical protein C8F01DRAFT_1077795 [Mycena amicta]